jgi:hypothetical protein
MLKIKTIKEKFDLNPIDKQLNINRFNLFVLKKNKNHFFDNNRVIDDYNNNNTIDYDSSFKKRILLIITIENSFIEVKINKASKKN